MSPDTDRDEQAIRTLVTTWIEATKANDLDRVLELMDDEVVFLGGGRPPMCGKAAFLEASRARGSARVDGSVTIQDVRVFGDWGYCWNQLSVRVIPEGGVEMQMEGPAMSLLRKKPDGRWVVFRDANMLTPVK
ncbi:MAG TPA: SgcJ/EcaC family oxidoreductase [Vicinamibacterales bacterium]|nr:SgcJ/EcaC family oxidoreductase [Vicinamibacterales bacterium]